MPIFQATKIKWILDNVKGARRTGGKRRAALWNGRDLADLEADERGLYM